MRKIGLLIVFMLGCSSSEGGDKASLYGDWIDEGTNGGFGLALTLRKDGTYTWSHIVVVSPSLANVEIETGRFTAVGDQFTATPEQWSCARPDPATTARYTLSDGALVLATPAAIISYKANSAPAKAINVAIGCFDAHGAFAASPLAPVTH